MIVYFSGTGNSRYCAQLLAARLGEELTDAFHFIRDGVAAELSSERPWIFVSPTYGWRQPRVFSDFIRAGRFNGSKAAYFVMTCGSEVGNAGAYIEELCAFKGFEYRGLLEAVMPENYVAMFPVPDGEESRRIIAAATPALERGAADIAADRAFEPRRPGAVDKLKSGPVNRLFYRYIISSKHFYSTDACVGCGKCERVCPTKNVSIKDGRPVWGDACTHCMACICGCPQKAVESGRLSLGKPRYQCPEYKD